MDTIKELAGSNKEVASVAIATDAAKKDLKNTQTLKTQADSDYQVALKNLLVQQ